MLDPARSCLPIATCTSPSPPPSVRRRHHRSPDHPLADDVFTFTTDAAPERDHHVAVAGATDTAVNANLTILFSEAVNVTGNGSRSSARISGMRNVSDTAVTGGPINFTINPTTDFASADNCTATVFAAQVGDQDANDPPDTMAANHVFTFVMDAAPAVTTTLPAAGVDNLATNIDLTITFSEPVNVTGTGSRSSADEWHAQRGRHRGHRRPDHLHDRPGRRLRAGRAVHGDGVRGAGDRSGRRAIRLT